MTRRYFVPDLPNFEGEIGLPTDEAYHAARVMRVRVGDAITLFDGRGSEAAATIVEVSKRDVRVSMCLPELRSNELACRLMVACPIPKGDRAKWLVEKLTELGCAVVWPLETERTQGTTGQSASQLEKLRRTIIEASKQCERNVLMKIAEKEPYDAFVSLSDQQLTSLAMPEKDPASPSSVHRLILDPGAPVALGEHLQMLTPIPPVIGDGDSSPPCYCLLAGPEGGLCDAERQLAETHGWQPVSLGKSILRIETAIIAAAAVVAFHSPSPSNSIAEPQKVHPNSPATE